MNQLEKALQNFWLWADLSPEEYKRGILPKNPNMNPGAEWETEYEHFQELEDAFIEEISNERNFDNPEFLKLVVMAIAIDNEGERLGTFASSLLSEACIEKVWCEALRSRFTVAQQVLVFDVKDSKSSHKRQFLHRFIEESGDDFVISRAQYALEHFV